MSCFDSKNIPYGGVVISHWPWVEARPPGCTSTGKCCRIIKGADDLSKMASSMHQACAFYFIPVSDVTNRLRLHYQLWRSKGVLGEILEHVKKDATAKMAR